MNGELSNFFYSVLDSIYNVTPSHKTDLPTKSNQSLNFVIDKNEQSDLLTDLVRFSAVYPFIKIDPITIETVEKWSVVNVEKPVPFKLKIENFENEPSYSYEGDYTIMNFKFGGRNFSLPIERIENTWNL